MIPFFMVGIGINIAFLRFGSSIKATMLTEQKHNISFLALGQKTEPSSLRVWGGGGRQGTKKRSKIYLSFSLGFFSRTRRNKQKMLYAGENGSWTSLPPMSHPVQIINVECLLDICNDSIW